MEGYKFRKAVLEGCFTIPGEGMGLPVNPALDDTGRILRQIVAGGADAILTTVGIAKRYEDEIKNIGLLLRMDGGGSCLNSDDESPDLLYTMPNILPLTLTLIIYKLSTKQVKAWKILVGVAVIGLVFGALGIFGTAS